jgi:hypothetical protein
MPAPEMRLFSEAADQAEIFKQRARARSQVVKRLLQDDLTLLEAAAWFRFLGDNPPELPDDFRKRYPGDSDGEKACRKVICWAQALLRLPGANSQTADRLQRLEDELDSLCARTGTVELPW